ncbi:Uma2 family endonuclease [Actinacidiphila glaucinigra]|uniref:Uma2 family endonuclease n=1 Tax=Actinacidiphila glaucinigra TaxID=235986 RepID=UPI003246937A
MTAARPARDRGPRRRGYAAAGIPFYLMVDRTEGTVTLYGEPDAEDYRQDVRVLFGKELDLPEPFAFALDTSAFG